MEIIINNISWLLVFVDPNDEMLLMPTGYTYGMTDVYNKIIYISDSISGDLLYDVLTHEICHCWLYSYRYEIAIPCEEIVCQVVERDSDYIQEIADEVYSFL